MYNYDYNYGLSEHKRSDTVKWVLTLVAFLIVGVMLAGIICGWFEKKEELPQEESEQAAVVDGEGNPIMKDTIYPMPKAMSFSGVARAPDATAGGSAVDTSQSVDVRIEAYVYPESAANTEVDFSVAWGNAPTHGSEEVTEYLTVTPDSDGSRIATVSCKKAFGNDTIIITVTTRDGGFTATCTVSFVGVASEINISCSSATQKTTAERGTYYELGTNKTYIFDINLMNAFDDVSSDLSVTEIGAYGTAYFGDRYSNDGGYYNYQNTYTQELDELADQFIRSATISGTTLTVTTGSKILENYYSSYALDEWSYDYAQNAYMVELDDYWNIKDASDTFVNSMSQSNAENLPSYYFYVTVKDSISGLSETVRLWLVSSVSGVSFSQNTLRF